MPVSLKHRDKVKGGLVEHDELELERAVRLLEKETRTLGEHFVELRRDLRGDIDALKLELEAIKRYLSQSSGDFGDRFENIKEHCRYEIVPD